MTEIQFWKIISESRTSFFEKTPPPNKWGMIEGVMNHQAEKLREILAKLSAEEIADFDRLFQALMDRAYSWDLWAAAYIMGGGGCSNDGFCDFRSWLISMGRDVFESATQNPETLATAIDRKDVEDFYFEEFSYVARILYEELTGNQLPVDVGAGSVDMPTGERWRDEELPKRLPILFAKCNSSKA